MKKTLFIAYCIAAATLFSGCGKDDTSEEKADLTTAVSTEASTYEVTSATDTTGDLTTETETDTTATTEAVSEEKTTGAAVKNTDNPFESMAGYWFVDGDPSLASIYITPTGKFESYYATGNTENTGFVTYEKSGSADGYVYTFCSEQGSKIMTVYDDKSLDADTFYVNETNTCYKRLFYDGGLGDDGRGPAEIFFGKWVCGDVTIYIDEMTEDTYYVSAENRVSGSTHTDWSYVCTFEQGRLICRGNGNKMTLSYDEDDDSLKVAGPGFMDGTAEFILDGDELIWEDKKEDFASGMRFVLSDD